MSVIQHAIRLTAAMITMSKVLFAFIVHSSTPCIGPRDVEEFVSLRKHERELKRTRSLVAELFKGEGIVSLIEREESSLIRAV